MPLAVILTPPLTGPFPARKPDRAAILHVNNSVTLETDSPTVAVARFDDEIDVLDLSVTVDSENHAVFSADDILLALGQ